MSRKQKSILILVLLLVGILVTVMVRNAKPRFDGRITLNRYSKAPYATYIAYNMLPVEFPQAEIKVNWKPLSDWDKEFSDSGKKALIIIDNYFDPTEFEMDQLASFVYNGNNVLISAVQMNSIAQRYFQVEEPSLYARHTLIRYGPLSVNDDFGVMVDTTRFTSGKTYRYPGAAYANDFSYINEQFAYRLGYNADSSLNFFGVDSEAGSFYVHSAPIAFTNFFLLYRDNYAYYRSILSLLPPDTEKIYWDEYFIRNKSATQSANNSRSLFSVFLEYDSFAWAFWTAILLIILYLLTASRRRQRELPEHTPPVNDSLDFVSTVGNLYFEKGDNKDMADKLIFLFLEQLRSRYLLSTTVLDAAFEQKLRVRSGLTEQEVHGLVVMIQHMQTKNNVTDAELSAFYSSLHQFSQKI